MILGSSYIFNSSVHYLQSPFNHVAKMVFGEYVKRLQTITGEDSPGFYEDLRTTLETEMFKIPLREIRGIVVGIRNCPPIKTRNLYISTGNFKGNSDLRQEMFNKLATITEKGNFVHLRTPFAASFDNSRTKQLIAAFQPIINLFFKLILQSSEDVLESPIPVLCLGKNSLYSVTKGLKCINRPKFVILSTVHPNNFLYLEMKISQTVCKNKRLYLIRRKYYNFDVFQKVLKMFVSLADM